MPQPKHQLIALCASAALAASTTGFANSELIEMQGDPSSWVMPNGDYASTRFSALDQIDTSNVKDLQVAWTFSTGVLRGHEGGPLVIGDVMYIHTPFPNKVFALDLNNDGKILWKYEPRQDTSVIPVMCCDTVNRGVAYGNGKIFLYQADTTLVALDAKTGEKLWSAVNGDPSKGGTGTSAPMVVKDKVYVGISGGEFGVRGYLTAYDTDSGKQVWRAYSMGPDADTLLDPENTTHLGKPVGKDSGTATWEGDQWKIGGGTTWGWYSYDPDLNLVYYGSGNPSTWNPAQRPGDNRWSMTIFARDADTGVAKWIYQMTPHDEWDYDGVNEMILVDAPFPPKDEPEASSVAAVTTAETGFKMRSLLPGRKDAEEAAAPEPAPAAEPANVRKLLVHMDRNGFAYTLDRVTGELLLAEKYDPAVNWATHVDMETGRPQVVSEYSTDQNGEDVNTTGVCPAALGTKDQQPAAYSPRTGLFYVPTNHVCMDYEPFQVSYTAGQPYVGATLTMYPAPGGDHLGNFIAWDAGKGEIVWSNPEPFSVWSGALATAGDVVFYGTLEGYLKAVDAKSGEELYRFKTPSGIIGNVNTYTHKGKQYVAVLSGLGGWAGIGMAAGLTDPTAGLGAVGAYSSLSDYTQLGGQLTVFTLPES
ncbi:methanol/ethanol family PQQ-dependent dehydrogenase [Thiorhodococcus minor]|uniref:Methanol/ethanol family PQQ-dependent dehydrogenase n=1 Tax=Thiorhodococcus minor TaxID=57489 RepID=A0A6M0K4T3_9GAMM|nr:methanol/ethanol family PQQ-dependent dehydrogenase [Thiorhodococcus minor]NEV64284.1 methanol/ethanol family PQQ-dependent dehydrogenase [Thiorhodococcus minor]